MYGPATTIKWLAVAPMLVSALLLSITIRHLYLNMGGERTSSKRKTRTANWTSVFTCSREVIGCFLKYIILDFQNANDVIV